MTGCCQIAFINDHTVALATRPGVVLAINLNSGTDSVISQGGLLTAVSDHGTAVEADGTLLVVDRQSRSLIRMDLQSGLQSIFISGLTDPFRVVASDVGTPADRDGDGIPNDVDNCPVTRNADQADMDGDGIGDVCDSDRDGDGVIDAQDNCPRAANADQRNPDGDALGDVCDPDVDGDGTLDEADNCPFIANAGQADFDNDGIGDACDDDADGDGTLDDIDNCQRLNNPSQGDFDGDGIGDACDNCAFTANALQEDHGGVGAAAGPDGIGDACQCGDVTGDGKVTLGDSAVILRSRLVPPV